MAWCTVNRAQALPALPLACSALSIHQDSFVDTGVPPFLSTNEEGRAYLHFIRRGGLDGAFSPLGHGCTFELSGDLYRACVARHEGAEEQRDRSGLRTKMRRNVENGGMRHHHSLRAPCGEKENARLGTAVVAGERWEAE